MSESQFMTLFRMLFVCIKMLVQIIGCVADRKTFIKYKEYFDVLEKELKDFEEGQKVV